MHPTPTSRHFPHSLPPLQAHNRMASSNPRSFAPTRVASDIKVGRNVLEVLHAAYLGSLSVRLSEVLLFSLMAKGGEFD